MTLTTTPDTRTRILDRAQELIQTRGFNGMSYADVAAGLGLTKAALHYHFPTKADLGLAVLARYTAEFVAALDAIDARRPTAADRLGAYTRLYVDVLEGERLCLCAVLAAEQRTLEVPLRAAVAAFFAANVRWLTEVIRLGRLDGTVAGVGSAAAVAEVVLGALEGAMLVAWSRDDVAGFRRAAEQVLASLAPAR